MGVASLPSADAECLSIYLYPLGRDGPAADDEGPEEVSSGIRHSSFADASESECSLGGFGRLERFLEGFSVDLGSGFAGFEGCIGSEESIGSGVTLYLAQIFWYTACS